MTESTTPIKITPEDVARGTHVDFKEVKNEWVDLTLEDGTQMKLKLEITSIVRLQKHQPDRNPIYQIGTHLVSRLCYVPPELMAKLPDDSSGGVP